MTDSTRPCTVEGCPEPHFCRGYCTVHYSRWRNTGDPGPAERLTKNRSKYERCEVDGCTNKPRSKGLCDLHYQRVRATGSTGPANRVKRRPGEPKPPCSVEGCGMEANVRKYCTMHYDRWRKYGDPGEAQPRIDRSPHQGCDIEGCLNEHYRKGYCSMHYQRIRTTGDPGPVGRIPKGSWNRTESVGYVGAHGRVRRLKGSASQYECVQCGSTAEEWAYNHQDPEESTDDRGLRYSSDPNYYQPMCVSCHRAHDTQIRKSTVQQQVC